MSRRENRSSEWKRRHSRFDREPRRDGKPETERPQTVPPLDRSDRDRHHRRLQDPLPLEAHGSKVESGNTSKESEKGFDGRQGATKYSSDSTKVPQSRSYFQHYDRGSAGQDGRSFSRRTNSERGWWRDPKEQLKDRAIDKPSSSDAHQKDGYFEMEANPKYPARKGPAFREQKIPAGPEKTSKAAVDPVIPSPQDHYIDSGRRYKREHNTQHSDRSERPFSGERESNKAQSWRGNFTSRNRYSANSGYRGGDRFKARQGQGHHPIGGRVEKWKHNLSDEANKSPPPI